MPTRERKKLGQMEDAVIVDLFWSRDERAIQETDKKYGKYCHKIAMNILKNQNDAEECVNTTYLNTWNAIPPSRPASLGAFVGRIARNLSLQTLRSKRAQKRWDGGELISFDELSECIPSPEEEIGTSTMTSEQLAALIDRYLRGISSEARLVFIGRYYYFESISDIADRLGIKESKVKTLLFRARNGLREFLTKEGVEI